MFITEPTFEVNPRPGEHLDIIDLGCLDTSVLPII